MRKQTRKQRYKDNKQGAKTYPIYIATISFQHEANLAFIIRSATCFGVKGLFVLGTHPNRHLMNEMSGSMFDYIDINYFSQSHDLLSHLQENNIQPVCLELPGENYDSVSIAEYQFNFDRPVCIIAGNESTGVPADILINSEVIYIPIKGIGACLNTSQAATIAMYECIKQYEEQKC